MSHLSRRKFLGSTAALSLAGAGALALPRRSRAQGANDTINVGLIGVGWRGGQLLDEILRVGGVKITALCDPDSARTAEAAENVLDAPDREADRDEAEHHAHDDPAEPVGGGSADTSKHGVVFRVIECPGDR